MKKVVLPPPQKMGDEGSPEIPACDVVRDSVLTLGFWRLGGLSRTEAAIEISDALDKDSACPVVSNDTANLWAEAMQLIGPKGEQVGNIQNPKANMFFLKIHRAVMRAETFEEKKPEKE